MKLLARILVRLFFIGTPAVIFGLLIFALAGMDKDAATGGLLMTVFIFYVGISATSPKKERGETWL